MTALLSSNAKTYDALFNQFSWQLPERMNMAQQVCDRWADGSGRPALHHVMADGDVWTLSFDAVKDQACRLANALTALGVARGDRIAILLPQRPETAIAHVAAYRMGAIALPLFTLFGPDAVGYRLGDSGAAVLITDRAGLETLSRMEVRPETLRHVVCVDGAGEGASAVWSDLLARASADHACVDTAADDPAVLIYTSGTTGQPKGALHGHRVLTGHLPGVEMSHDRAPKPGDCFWTPADWAWIGGLLDVLLPAWFHGLPVVSHRFAKFDAEAAVRLMVDRGVRNVFLPPTALKMMRDLGDIKGRFGLDLRSVASGGETLGAAMLDWGRTALGLTINEFYGQTECNMIVSSCAELMPARSGLMGRPVPGHRLQVINPDTGEPRAEGEAGVIAVHRPDPVMFLRYWNNPAATEAKFVGDWMLTGDVGAWEDGWLRYVGRDDDVISSGGYRIGPGEIEDCLISHPSVRMAAVVGVPDEVRGQAIKAFLVAADGVDTTDDALTAELKQYVRSRLAAHEYPRHIQWVDGLPMTATGKIIRRQLRDPSCTEGLDGVWERQAPSDPGSPWRPPAGWGCGARRSPEPVSGWAGTLRERSTRLPQNTAEDGNGSGVSTDDPGQWLWGRRSVARLSGQLRRQITRSIMAGTLQKKGWGCNGTSRSNRELLFSK